MTGAADTYETHARRMRLLLGQWHLTPHAPHAAALCFPISLMLS
jgi:hypothetical protein